MKQIYLDNASTTRVSSGVLNSMKRYFTSDFGNASSPHELGERAFFALTDARKKFAREIGCKPEEIIFTSGATEANNLALQGIARANIGGKKKIIISEIEHASIVETCEFLKREGFIVQKIKVDRYGNVDLNSLEKAIDGKTLLVSIAHVNNVIGAIQDISKISRICKKNGVIFHTDASQSFGKLKIDVSSGIDMLSASAHKIGGPKGVGLLFVRNSVGLKPLMFGGGQEGGMRSGTENVPAVIGFASALDEIKKVDKDKIVRVRDYFVSELEKIGGKMNGSRDRIYNNIHVSFDCDAERLVLALSQKGIYLSTGSACDSKRVKEDYVLKAIGLIDKEMKGSLRITLNEEISRKDVDFVVRAINNLI